MSDLNKAVLDLNYLAERLSGILELRDSLGSYDEVVKRTESLTETEKVYREAVETAKAEQLQVVLETEVIRSRADQALSTVKQEIEDARVKAELVSASYASARKSEMDAAVAGTQAKLDALQKQIIDKRLEFSDVITKVTEAEQRLTNVNRQITALKNSI